MTAENRPYYTETQLLDALALGEEAAFTQVYSLLYKPLFYYACRFTEKELAEDVLTESFVKLYRSRKPFQSLQHVSHWLRVVVHNSCLNIFREEKRRSLRQEKAALGLSDAHYQLLFEQDSIEAGLFSRLEEAVNRLPARQQQIVRLFYIEGMDAGSIASRLRISAQSVMNQKTIALRSLRRRFDRQELMLFALLVSLA